MAAREPNATFVVARQYSDFKEQSIAEPSARAGNVQPLRMSLFPYELVGLGRIELPTSPLSGVRSSQLSYRPKFGGAGRDRTGDLLNANQALSQLSYSPGLRNHFNTLLVRSAQARRRRLVRCARSKRNDRGRLDADRKTSSRPIKERFIELEKRETEAWTGKAVTYLIRSLALAVQ